MWISRCLWDVSFPLRSSYSYLGLDLGLSPLPLFYWLRLCALFWFPCLWASSLAMCLRFGWRRMIDRRAFLLLCWPYLLFIFKGNIIPMGYRRYYRLSHGQGSWETIAMLHASFSHSACWNQMLFGCLLSTRSCCNLETWCLLLLLFSLDNYLYLLSLALLSSSCHGL